MQPPNATALTAMLRQQFENLVTFKKLGLFMLLAFLVSFSGAKKEFFVVCLFTNLTCLSTNVKIVFLMEFLPSSS